jgi:hypothetical protein
MNAVVMQASAVVFMNKYKLVGVGVLSTGAKGAIIFSRVTGNM